MIDVNIDDFYHDMAVILLSLHQQFPRKVTLYVEDICGPDQTDEFGLHSVRYSSCVGAIMWLKDEGYIRYESLVREEAVEAASLTQKAFVMLIQPRTLNQEEQVIEHPASVSRHRSSLAFLLHQAIERQSSIELRDLIESYFFSF